MISVENKTDLHQYLGNRLAQSEIIAKTAETTFEGSRDCMVGTKQFTIFTADKMIKAMRHAAFDFYSQLIDEGQKPLADEILKNVREK